MKLSDFMKGFVIPGFCIALGSAAAVAVVGSSSEEHALLKSRLADYRKLGEDHRKMVKASFAEFSIQTDDRKREIIALHGAVQNDPKLKEGLERYFEWWSSLSQTEWDSFPEMSREQQIGFAKARINKQTETEKTVVVDFGDWGATSLQPLHLTIEECGQIITDSLNDIQIPPEIADELQQLESPEHRSLALSLWMFEGFRIDPDRETRAVQREKTLNAVLANVSDVPWKDQFEQIVAVNSDNPFFKFWMLRNLLDTFDQSTMGIGNRLTKQIPVSEDEIVAALGRSLLMFDEFRIDPDRRTWSVQREKMLNAVLENVSDVEWKDQFEQIVADNSKKPFFKFWMLRNLLVIFDQSTMALGNRLTKQFPVSEDEIITAFVNLGDKSRQYSLMVMPSDEASMRLEFLAQSNRAQTPEQKLLAKFVAFARDRQRIIGGIIFGLGNRPPQNGSGGQQPRGRDGRN